jgi:2-keto-4-pentenoate hydratase/2-oxohepta-3-ene-1,7-dioic acid hydratase in catechol pathway
VRGADHAGVANGRLAALGRSAPGRIASLIRSLCNPVSRELGCERRIMVTIAVQDNRRAVASAARGTTPEELMAYAIEFGPQVTLPVAESSKLFPVGRIYCVGRNYAEHAREMGHDPEREPPFFFMKPADAIVPNGATIAYPTITEELHHEI